MASPSPEEARGSTVGNVIGRVLRTGGVALSVLGYVVIGPMGYLPFAFFCWRWRNQPEKSAFRLQTCIQQGFRFTVKWLRFWRVADCRCDGVLAALPQGACVVVCNHPTQLDVIAVGACLGRSSTIVKPSVFNRRLVKPLLRGAGLLEGPGRDPISIGRVIDDGVRCVKSGMKLYVFPEGTRSEPHRLQSFGRVAFEIACRADVPLVVLGARCEPVYLSREAPLFRPPHPMPRHRLELLAIERPAEHGHDSRKLCAKVQQRLRSWYLRGAPAAAVAPAQSIAVAPVAASLPEQPPSGQPLAEQPVE